MSLTNKTNNRETILPIILSAFFGLSFTILIIFGKNVLPTNSSMLACSNGMIDSQPSSLLYKCLVIGMTLMLPFCLLFFSNLKILLFVSKIIDSIDCQTQ